MGNILVIMVGSDKAIRKMKGNSHPILNEQLRLKMVDSIKPVDYAFLDAYVNREDLKDFLLDKALRLLKPDVYVVNKDRDDIAFREVLFALAPRSSIPQR